MKRGTNGPSCHSFNGHTHRAAGTEREPAKFQQPGSEQESGTEKWLKLKLESCLKESVSQSPSKFQLFQSWRLEGVEVGVRIPCEKTRSSLDETKWRWIMWLLWHLLLGCLYNISKPTEFFLSYILKNESNFQALFAVIFFSLTVFQKTKIK